MEQREDDFVYNRSKVIFHGEREIEHETILTQDIIPAIEHNLFLKLNDPQNGFSDQRHLRRIASIPVVVEREAQRLGYDLSNTKDLRRFLEKYPEFMTVKQVDTGRSGKVIVK
jgi:hypothetical protein